MSKVKEAVEIYKLAFRGIFDSFDPRLIVRFLENRGFVVKKYIVLSSIDPDIEHLGGVDMEVEGINNPVDAIDDAWVAAKIGENEYLLHQI